MRFIVLLIKILRFFLGNFIKPLVNLAYKFYYRKIDKPSPLPKIKNLILLLPAHVLAEKIRNKEISSLELVQIYINRIKEIQPLVNCVVKSCFDEALEQAKIVDEILNSPSINEKYSAKNAPLLGVPFSCKESFWIKGMPNSTGLIARKDFRAPDDADVVKYMREAGAILTCITNTSELCMWLESSNYLYGTTNNPYNLSRIVGGSSGGEGCLVSSAGSVIGIGSDIGGSIRIPSYFNGVYGHKTSSNFIKNDCQHPPAIGLQDNMLSVGPICRYASDLRLMFKILTGPRYAEVQKKFETPVDLKKLKYYYIKGLHGNYLTSDLSKDSKIAFKKAIEFVEKSLNVEVKEIHLPKLKCIFQIWTSMMKNGEVYSDTFSRLMAGNENNKINPFYELLKSILGIQTKHTLPAIILSLTEILPVKNPKYYIQLGEKLKQELKIILADDGILFSPSFPNVAPYHNQPSFTNTLDFIYFGTFNVFGFPVTQVPMGLSESERLPTGVQIVANHLCDHLTIRMAEHFESNLVGWIQPS